MGIGNAILDVMSLGAHRRVRRSADKYEQLRFQAEFTYELLDKSRSDTIRALQELAETRAQALKTLARMRKLLSSFGAPSATVPDDDQLPEVKCNPADHKPDDRGRPEAMSAGRVFVNGAKGAGVGVTAGAGTLALTGGLSAAAAASAATPATVATVALLTLGGGPTAAGGLGVAGGAAVLGGVTLIPAMAVSGFLGHKTAQKKVVEFEEARQRTAEELSRFHALTAKVDAVHQHAREVRSKITEHKKDLDQARSGATRSLFPLGAFSRQYRRIRVWAGGQYYNDEELKIVLPLLDKASELANLIKTPVLSLEQKSELAVDFKALGDSPAKN